MRRSLAGILTLAALVPLADCAMNKAEKGAIIGAGAGGAVGAVIGNATGSTVRGAIIGAAVGGVAGALIGRVVARGIVGRHLRVTITVLPPGEGVAKRRMSSAQR